MTPPEPPIITEPLVLNYKRDRRLSKGRMRTALLLGLLGLMFLLLLAGGAGYLMVIHIWTLYHHGKPWSHDEAALGQSMPEACSVAFVPTAALIAPALMFWMYKTHRSLQRLKPGTLRTPASMNIWAWIIPYWCLIRPYEMMRALYIVSRGEPIRKFRPSIGCWWALWLVTNVISIFGAVALSRDRAEEAERAIDFATFGMLVAYLYAVDCALLGVTIFRIDRAERRLQNTFTS